jgi:hypothetical protein
MAFCFIFLLERRKRIVKRRLGEGKRPAWRASVPLFSNKRPGVITA